MKCVILAGGAGNTLWPLQEKNIQSNLLIYVKAALFYRIQ